MHILRKYILLFIIGFLPLITQAYHFVNSDTIPPTFTVTPQNLSVDCGNASEANFLSWYASKANAETDDSQAQINPTLSQNAAIDSFNRVINGPCQDSKEIVIGFFAQDSCNNVSNTLPASYIITDNSKPTFSLNAQNKEVYCSNSVKDTLQAWINSFGGAMAIDNCSDTIFGSTTFGQII